MNIVNKKQEWTKLLSLQVRIIHALILREILAKFGVRKLGYFWIIAETLMQVAIFAGIKFALGITMIKGVHFIPFLVTGIVPFIYFRNTVMKTMAGVRANRGLLSLAQINFFDLFYARFFLETATYIMVFICALLITHFFIAEIHIHNMLMVLYAFFLMGFIGFGIGLIFSVIVSIFDSFKVIVGVYLKILYFTSGILFSLALIPQEYWPWIALNPVVHTIEALRNSFFFSYSPTDAFLNLDYAFKFMLVINLIGFLLVRKMKKWVLR